MFFDCPFISESRIQYTFVKKLGKDFSTFIEESVRNGFYVSLEINRNKSFLPYYTTITVDRRHYVLIYGFDEHTEEFLYSDFYSPSCIFAQTYIQKLRVHKNLLNKSLNNLGLFTEYNSGATDFIRLLYFDSTFQYEYSRSFTKRQLYNFLSSQNLYDMMPIPVINMHYRTFTKNKLINLNLD